MSKLMELVGDYGDQCFANGREDSLDARRAARKCEKELLSEIRAAVAELERDAARYRWLRVQPYEKWRTIAWNLCPDTELVPYVSGLRDKEIDAAMEAANG